MHLQLGGGETVEFLHELIVEHGAMQRKHHLRRVKLFQRLDRQILSFGRQDVSQQTQAEAAIAR